MFAVYACETVSGKNLGRIPALVQNWRRELNGTDTASVVLAPGALTTATRDNYRLLTTPARMTCVIEWTNPGDTVGTPVFAGPFWNRKWDDKTTLNATGIKSILDRRKLVTWAPPYQTQVLQYANMTLGSIAAQIVGFVTSNSKPGAGLPITLPSTIPDTDPTHVKTYQGFNLKTAGSALTDLTNLINGPDIDFLPTWADATRSAINYQMRVGTTTQPQLYAPSKITFDASQPKSSVKKITYVDDSSQLATTQYGNGAGSDVDTLMSAATNPNLVNLGWPALEQQTDYKTETVQAKLDAAVQGDLAVAQKPTEQWGLIVDGTLAPVLGSYNLGDIAKVRVANHVWIPDGDYTQRVIAIQGDATTSVTLSVQGA